MPSEPRPTARDLHLASKAVFADIDDATLGETGYQATIEPIRAWWSRQQPVVDPRRDEVAG